MAVEQPLSLSQALAHAFLNRAELARSRVSGCFCCLAIFQPHRVRRWRALWTAEGGGGSHRLAVDDSSPLGGPVPADGVTLGAQAPGDGCCGAAAVTGAHAVSGGVALADATGAGVVSADASAADDPGLASACCPVCGRCAVVGDASGLVVRTSLLVALRQCWADLL